MMVCFAKVKIDGLVRKRHSGTRPPQQPATEDGKTGVNILYNLLK